MIWFEATSSTVPLTAIQNIVPYYKGQYDKNSKIYQCLWLWKMKILK